MGRLGTSFILACILAHSALGQPVATQVAPASSCVEQIQKIYNAVFRRDLWKRDKDKYVYASAKLLAYPFVGVGKGVYFVFKGARNYRDLPRVFQEAVKSYRKDLVYFAGHMAIYIATQSLMTTYDQFENKVGPPKDPGAVVVVIDGFYESNPLREEAKNHFLRSYGENPNAHFVERGDKEEIKWTEQILKAFRISQKEGPLQRLEIHADMNPGNAIVTGDSANALMIRHLPKLAAEHAIDQEENRKDATEAQRNFYATDEYLEAREARVQELESKIRNEMMAPGGEVVLYGCSVANGPNGKELLEAIRETFLSRGGRAVGPRLDLYRDYPDYFIDKTLDVHSTSIRRQLNAGARYSMATAYLLGYLGHKASSSVGPDSDGIAEVTFACPLKHSEEVEFGGE